MDEKRIQKLRVYMSDVEIARKLHRENPTKTVHQYQLQLSRRVGLKNRPEIVGVIGDTHFPFVHPYYLEFLQDMFHARGVTKIVHIGDMVDHHAISRHLSEPDGLGAMQEFECAMEHVRLYTEAFPEATLLLGNHDRIPERQAAELGLPSFYVKSFAELFELPKSWTVTSRLVFNDVVYEHGINWSGKTGALNKAVAQMQSCVIGHSHSFGGCTGSANVQKYVFGLNSGCGIDIDAYAFRYGKYSKYRETLGCGIVYNRHHAEFIPMFSEYFRSNVDNN